MCSTTTVWDMRKTGACRKHDGEGREGRGADADARSHQGLYLQICHVRYPRNIYKKVDISRGLVWSQKPPCYKSNYLWPIAVRRSLLPD
jgi:hypothetical protein